MSDNLEMEPENIDKLLWVGKEAVMTAASYIPFLSGFTRALDKIESAAAQQDLQSQIDGLYAIIGRKGGQNFGLEIGQMIQLASSVGALGLRHEKACMVLAEWLNHNSPWGMSGEPNLEAEEAYTLLREKGVPDPEKAYMLAAHELESHNLVEKESYIGLDPAKAAIRPSDDFFLYTDSLFQPWIPSKDALAAIGIARESEGADRSALSEEVMRKLGWSHHRMNSALRFLDTKGLVHPLQIAGGTNLYGWYFRLTIEAENFWIDNQPA